MNFKETGNFSINTQKTTYSLPKALAAALLTAQASANFLLIPAAIASGTAPGNFAEKTIDGIKVPVDIIEWIMSIPENIQTVEDLDTFMQETETEGIRESLSNFWDKTVLWAKLGSDITWQAFTYAMDQLKRMEQWADNFKGMPLETLLSIIAAILTYFTISFWAKTLRLWDRDGLGDRLRKKGWKFITNTSDEQIINRRIEELGKNDEEILSLLNNLTTEYKRRNNNNLEK